MSHRLGNYSFLPFLRNGVAGLITVPDDATQVALRASLSVQLTLEGQGGNPNPSDVISRNVQLYGPGDVVGIDRRGIVRMEPRHWATNVEPNYLAHIEFYDEDFPWRYTPAVAANERLRPWIALVVLEEGEFKDDLNPDAQQSRKPEERISPRIKFTSAAEMAGKFPPADQLWAWAHVHVNRTLTSDDTVVVPPDPTGYMPTLLTKLHGFIDEDPDLAFSRLICSRKLGPDKAYHAFVVPSFESGRLAALQLDQTKAPSATHSAWASYQGKDMDAVMPYFHRWYFRTGGAGDFESLVRLLQPQPVDSRVGTRDLDVSRPDSNLPPIEIPDLGSVLKLGGALKVPDCNYDAVEKAKVERYEKWDQPYPHPFQKKLARLINLADDYATKQASAANSPVLGRPDEDPIITPPLYGTWHSLTKRLLYDQADHAVPNQTNWVHKLNLDPRHRVAAGFGTRVIQQNQELYMDAAWGQVGAVVEANRQIRMAQLARHASNVLYSKHLGPIYARDAGRTVLMTAPVFGRIVQGGVTLQHKLSQSVASRAMTSVVTRRLVRPGGRIRRLTTGTAFAPGTLVRRVATGALNPAPARTVAAGAVTLQKFVNLLPVASRPALLLTVAVHAGMRRAATLPALRTSPNFKLTPLGPIAAPTLGATDSPEAVRFKTAVREAYALLDLSEASAPRVQRPTLQVDSVAARAFKALDPNTTIKARLRQRMPLPLRILGEIGDDLVEVLAYPVIDDPMYKPLSNISPELLLPHINLIPPNSVTLLETNQPFIEAYMVGLNHEFARELLWREYPTDQRGSTFRQFWDATDSLAAAAPTDLEQAKERLRDITRLHCWSKSSVLGSHNNRKLTPAQRAQCPSPSGPTVLTDLVLVIRGELLKRYPTAVIYAHRGQWKTEGSTTERTLATLSDQQEDNPPRGLIRTPLYEAKVDPDVYFFGFDLKATDVAGGAPNPQGDPGWYFVIKERPGEPRFGLDSDKQQAITVWNDLSWADVQPGNPGTYIQATSATPTIPLSDAGVTDVTRDQHADDRHVTWGPNMSSADIAYILFQAPVLIAVHGSELLGKTCVK